MPGSASPASSTGRMSKSSPARPGTGDYSVMSKSRRRKKQQPVYNLEEVFNQVSNVTGSDLTAPPARIVLTPRSAEACLKLGINPEILKIRDIDSFWEPGIEPAVQRMRHEAYVQRRHETMKQCRLERKRVMNSMMETSGLGSSGSKGGEEMTPEMILQKQKEQSSTLIQMELARIEKMQRRQEKELEQMIQFEVNRAKLQEDMNTRMENEKYREEMKKRQAEKRAKLAAEERRLKELQRVAMEEMEEENRRMVARKMHEKEKELAEQRARQLAEEKRRMAEAERERAIKAAEHKAAVQKYFADEQQRLRERLENMHMAEKKKHEALMERQREHAEKLRIRREKIEKRLEMNLTMAERIEAKRKADFLERQEHHERIRAEALARQEQERMLQAQETMLQEQRRRMILLQQRRDEELQAERLLQKFDEEEQQVMAVQRLREKEHTIHNERKKLRQQMKLENVERVMRQVEYKKSSTLKKIEDTDDRVKKMLDLKWSLVDERRRAAAKTRIMKEQVAKVMEEVRSNATVASKIISLAVTGEVPLRDLAMGEGLKRSTSAGRTRKKKMKGSRSASQLMGLTSESEGEQRATKSAGGEPSYTFDQTNGEKPPEAGTFVTAGAAPAQDPLPYISPYELPQG